MYPGVFPARPNCLICSLKYAPGLYKEFRLLGDRLASHGVHTTYLVSSEYRKHTSSTAGYEFVSKSDGILSMICDTLAYPFSLGRKIRHVIEYSLPSLVIIYNPHPANALVLRSVASCAPDAKRTIYLHEPAKPNKLAYGLVGWFYYQLVEWCQDWAVRQANTIIVASHHGMDLFTELFPNFKGEIHLAPLLLHDDPVRFSGDRRFFTMAGRMNEGKGLDTFLTLIEDSAAQGLEYEFMLCTASPIEHYLHSLSDRARARLTVINHPSLTDEEIYQVIAQSRAVFLLHKTATQSGMMPVAFMHGTPVIARNLEAFSQFIEHHANSCLVPRNATSWDLLAEMAYVVQNQDGLSSLARRTFETTFSEINWDQDYHWLITTLFSNSKEDLKRR